jgi:hypothetical protein
MFIALEGYNPVLIALTLYNFLWLYSVIRAKAILIFSQKRMHWAEIIFLRDLQISYPLKKE